MIGFQLAVHRVMLVNTMLACAEVCLSAGVWLAAC